MTKDENKIDAIDSITFGLSRAAEWRDRMAIRHPSDSRNLRGADCLRKLAAEVSQLTDEDWKLLQPYYGWASEPFREAVSTAARAVAFKHKIKDIPSFVKHLLDVLSQPSVAA